MARPRKRGKGRSKQQPAPRRRKTRPAARKRKASTSSTRSSSSRSTSSGPRTAKVEKGSKPTASPPLTILYRLTPTKSPQDPHEYRVLQLSNGLTVSLISQKQRGIPSAKRLTSTSIALVVNSGCSEDPAECQGLAHLTEHMVHLGCSKFPRSDDHYELHMNFGSLWNAETHFHKTMYFHQIPDFLLNSSFDLFASMLAAPSFDLGMISKEVNAVDSEFHMRLDDHLRSLMLMQHVCIGNKEHPLRHFLCGSLETLRRSEEVQKYMIANHSKNYVASACTLCVNSTKSLAELENLVMDNMSNLKQGERKTCQKTSAADKETSGCLELQNFDKLIIIQGLTSRASLTFTWALPASLWMINPQERVLDMIVAMFKDSSPRSLQGWLKKEGYIWHLTASHLSTRYTVFLDLCFEMTEKGRSVTSHILQATYAYLAMLQNTPEETMRRLFEEMRIQHQAAFHYGSHNPDYKLTTRCANSLQQVTSCQDMLTRDSWEFARFNYARTVGALRQFQPTNMVVLEVKPKDVPLSMYKMKYKGVHIQTAPYTKAKYLLIERDDDFFLQNCPIRHNFEFVPPNEFIHFLVQTGAGDASRIEAIRPVNHGDILPQKLSCPESTALGSKASKVLGGVHTGHRKHSYAPYGGHLSITFLSPAVWSTPRRKVLTNLWVSCVNEFLSSQHSQFSRAGYCVVLGCFPDSVYVNIFGFPTHMQAVFEKVMGAVFSEISSETLILAKEALRTRWEMDSVQPSLAYDVLRYVLFEGEEMAVDGLTYLDEVTLQDVKNNFDLLRNSCCAHILLGGNLPVQMFGPIVNKLETLDFSPKCCTMADFVPSWPPRCSMLLPGERCVRVRAKGTTSLCTAVLNVYNLGRACPEDSEYFFAALSFMNCQAFIYLRTQCQLGYSVEVHNLGGGELPMNMFSICVISTASKFSPCEVDKKIDEFLERYCDYLENLSESLFENMRKLNNIPSDINPKDVAAWFQQRFGNGFRERERSYKCICRGISKLSVQVVGINPKSCDCEECCNVQQWESMERHQLEFAKGEGPASSYFVSDLDAA